MTGSTAHGYLVASLEDLITMTSVAGRLKDAGQVELLRVAADELRRAGDIPKERLP